MDKKIINPWQWQEKLGFVQANDIAGAKRMIFCSGQVPVDGDGRLLHPGKMMEQIHQALDNLETVLAGAGLQLSDVVRLNYYTTDIPAFRRAEPELAKRLKKSGCRPASTLLGVSALYHPDILVEIEATAAV